MKRIKAHNHKARKQKKNTTLEKRKASTPKNKHSGIYEPLLKTKLTFEQLLKVAAHTPLPEDEKIKGSRSKK